MLSDVYYWFHEGEILMHDRNNTMADTDIDKRLTHVFTAIRTTQRSINTC